MQWHQLTARETLARMGVSPEKGLSVGETMARRADTGPNCLAASPGKGPLRRFLAQFDDFMVLLLLGAAGISLALSFLTGERDFLDPIIILAIVVLNAALGMVQEGRAARALEALSRMSEPRARVLREGMPTEIPARDVVPGDILLLESGCRVPADARLLSARSLMLREASLTGESQPVSKDADCVLPETASLGDRRNMVFSGTDVVSGRGKAVAVATGMHTQVGAIAGALLESEPPPTPLQQRLDRLGKVLGIGAIAVCAVIFCLGILRRAEPLELFMTSVSLAVAAIPEGLPATVTVVLAMGVRKMVGRNAIVRSLHAAETLGHISVICSDKTGTLTCNRMTVARVTDGASPLAPDCPACRQVLFRAALCCGPSPGIPADPTEDAILRAAREADEAALLPYLSGHPRLAEQPFDPVTKRMSTLHRTSAGLLLAVKGAPDRILPLCTHWEDVSGVHPLSAVQRENILRQVEAMGSAALRTLAVAVGHPPAGTSDASVGTNLIFQGLVGITDPPRPEAREAVAQCRRAGIRPMMITGDHVATAAAVARDLDILREGDRVLSGGELDSMDDAALGPVLRSTAVCARVTPEHKRRIVRLLQADGRVVAMTGDGVNDAPALQTADIGCAMGQSGTDVARSAADMILTDDNFATVVEAVRQGRGIYANIRKGIHFLLSSNMGELITLFAGTLLGWPSPLLAIQLLWVNLITDSLPAIALGMDPIDDGIMEEPPLPPRTGLFAGGMGWDILWEGALIGSLALLAFLLGLPCDAGGEPVTARTMAFTVLSVSQLLHTLNIRSRRSLFSRRVPVNIPLLLSLVLCIGLQVAVVALPPLASAFRVVPLTAGQWASVALLSAVPLAACEAQKALSRRK